MTLSIRYSESSVEIVDSTDVVRAELPASASSDEISAALATWEETADGDRHPDWADFKSRAMGSALVSGVLVDGQRREPQAVAWLPVALSQAEAGRLADFDLAWGRLRRAGVIGPELAAEFSAVAEACGLPAPFVALLRSGR
jgi:hypothetical protein